MNGRLEQNIVTDKNIQKMLKELPPCVTEYYYSICSGSEPKTCEDYIKKIRGFLMFLNDDPKNVKISDITDTNVGMYVKNLESRTDKEGKLICNSFSYQKGVWTALNGFFKYLVKKGSIQGNPIELIKRPSNKDEVKRVSLNEEEINKIIKSINLEKNETWKTRDMCIFTILISTGMRREALREINISDIDFDNRTIKVIDKRHKEFHKPIQKNTFSVLLKWIGERSEFMGSNNCDALFISNRKQRMSDKSIYNVIKKHSKDAIGYSVSPHKLRASFGTLYYENNGHDIELTRQAMGHASVSMTQKYIVTNNDAEIDAANMIDSIIDIE